MCRLLETIKITREGIHNLDFHNARCNHARKSIFGARDQLDLGTVIDFDPERLPSPLVKCRVLYAERVESVAFEAYRLPVVRSLKLVFDDTIDYSFKYENRADLLRLREERGPCDDVLIVTHDRLTDTSFSNIVLYDGEKYVTPLYPLLPGVKRARLLADGTITAEDLQLDDLARFTRLSLINSMIDLEDDISIPISVLQGM